MAILVVGGDSVSAITERAYAGGHGCVQHWSGRKTRDLMRSIPKDTEAVVLVLDRVNHTLARKVRTEATRRGLPVFFQKRGRQVRAAGDRPLDVVHWLDTKDTGLRKHRLDLKTPA
ncbi:MAG: DUF2325 domain-containing protein [Nitrospira sp.]|nr:DUF2325 domain-containing protein [Nitrospira sp.]MCW5796140.1 DUF2325 domain-containing protein [Nitrospira sp.]HMW88163.1 DUF2325 domain-containing protein [Nitrospira sp.]HMZ96798.1 DUF2325 domain-containing protein [Nitrospira sp.]HNA48676.1 DUF2325 domain-containing protein [Nitrospira sp.]